MDHRRLTVLAARDGNLAAVMDHAVEIGFLAVQRDRGQRAHAAGEGLALAADVDHEAETRMTVVLAQVDTRIEQCIADRELAEVEKAGFLAVDGDGEEVQRVQ